MPPEVESGHPGPGSPLEKDGEHLGEPRGSPRNQQGRPGKLSPHLAGFKALTAAPHWRRAFTLAEVYSISFRPAINIKVLTHVKGSNSYLG